MTDWAQLRITASPGLLVQGGGGPVLLNNTDANNTVWMSADQFDLADVSQAAPLPPLGSVVFDGKTSVWGVCTSGTATVSRYPGGLNFFQLVELLLKTLLIAGSAGNGLYVYSAAPAVGDLIASIVAVGGSDPFGNVTFKGITSYDPGSGLFAELDAAELSISTISGINRVALMSVITPTSGLQLSGFNGAAVSTLYLIGDAAGNVVVAGTLAAQQPGAVAATPESWHPLGTLAGYTVNVARYRLAPWCSSFELDISVLAGGANAGNVSFSNTPLSSPYRLGNGLSSTAYPLRTNRAIVAGDVIPGVVVGSNGGVSISNTPNSAGLLTGQAFVPIT